MQRRHDSKHIPIEILRTFVMVIDAGSFTKAAEWLNLSQAAVSAQMKRLREILQGDLFMHGAGSPLTNRGKATLDYARQIVALNDELIATAGPKSAPRKLVIGLPRWYDHARLVELIRECSAVPLPDKLMFRCGSHREFVTDLKSGCIDVGYLCNVTGQPGKPLTEWLEPTYWIKAPSLKLDPDSPVPLIGWPGSLSEDIAGKLLRDAGLSYEIVFTSSEHGSRKAAVAAGLGMMIMLEHAMTPELEIVRESFLPKPPMIKTGIYAREGLNARRVAPLLRTLEKLLKSRPTPRLVAVQASRRAAGHSP
jgi:DNA-binding transcriptional LysR family regulator